MIVMGINGLYVFFMVIDIYTDGSCDENGFEINTGGFGVVLVDKEKDEVIYEINQVCADTTNNRMELMAVVEALCEVLARNLSNVTIYSDSMYCVRGMNDWRCNWKEKNFNRKIKNQDLWLVASNLMDRLTGKVEVKWIKAHNGHKYNERADELAGMRETLL